eukprot:362091_1
MPSRSSKARKSKVQCKTCWDNGNITAQYSIDYLKNNHGPQQNGPRRPTDRKKKIPHPVIELVPSQWVEYVHYYPISKKGKVITKPKRTSFFKTQTQLTSPTSFTKPHKPILPRPSSKASNMRGNTSNVSKRKRKRMDMENDIEDTSSNNQEQPRKKMKQCFEDALKASVEANKIVTINEIDNMMSGLDNDMTQMSKQQIIETQAQIIDSLICNTLQYKNGEKSGGAKELAAGYKKVFTMLGILSDIARRLKSVVFDNEYFEKRVVLQICLQYYLQKKK